MIKRMLEDKIKEGIAPGRVVVLYGSRRTGKTTLVNKIAEAWGERCVIYNGEVREVAEIFSSRRPTDYNRLIGNKEILIIDEAQQIPDIGRNLKLLVDTQPQIKVLATGSSSFDLANQVGEPLTGRQEVFTLYPLSQEELLKEWGIVEVKGRLEEILIYGSYPETINRTSNEAKERYLKLLAKSYLYKDILSLVEVRNSRQIADLLVLLAYQIGSEVSLSHLAQELGMSRNTIVRYLDLLEKSFVVFQIRGFSHNLRSEVTKNSRYYFWDNGVRNAIINNFNPLRLRGDIGQLWENFLAAERVKRNNYQEASVTHHFWRTYNQQEVDWVEKTGGKLQGFEFKWKKDAVAPSLWREIYPEASFQVINQENYLDFLT